MKIRNVVWGLVLACAVTMGAVSPPSAPASARGFSDYWCHDTNALRPYEAKVTFWWNIAHFYQENGGSYEDVQDAWYQYMLAQDARDEAYSDPANYTPCGD
jgi:hypothetical protein